MGQPAVVKEVAFGRGVTADGGSALPGTADGVGYRFFGVEIRLEENVGE
jgi:hypothetical protein